MHPLSSALTHTLTHYDPAASSSQEDVATPTSFSHQRSLTDTFFDRCSPLVQKATSALQQQTSKVSLPASRKSFANFISPAARNSNYGGLSSPTKSKGSKALGDWFSGSSAPVNIGLVPAHQRNFDPTDDEADEEEEMFSQWKGGREPQRPAPSSSPSKFSWILGNNSNTPTQESKSRSNSKAFEKSEDELLRLNIDSALFPHGHADPLHPASFNDLLAAAESVVQRYKDAYRQQHILIAELRAEQSAQDDELDGAETRSRHLKLQLDDMAARAAEQNRDMQNLRSELDAEREPQEARGGGEAEERSACSRARLCSLSRRQLRHFAHLANGWTR